MSVRSRIIKNIGANAFGQLVAVMTQLASVPVFLSCWGVPLYGEWLLISAIPAYLAMCDLGFASVAANEMTIRYASGDKAGALRIFQSAWVFILFISVIGLFFSLFGVFVFPIRDWLSLSNMPENEFKLVLATLLVYVIVNFQTGLVAAPWRATGKYASATMIVNLIRLLEWLGSIVMLLIGGQPLDVALTMLGGRFAGVVLMYLLLNFKISDFEIGYENSSYIEIRRMYVPAFSFMAFPLGLSLGLQGMTLMVGAFLGAEAVVIFTAYRTLTRVLVQGVTTLNQGAWPEISAAFGAQKNDILKNIFLNFSRMNFWLGVACLVAIWGGGNHFIEWWTRGKVHLDNALLLVMLLAAFLNIMWQMSWVFLMAINKHYMIARVFILSGVLSIVFAFIFSYFFGLPGVGWGMVIAEIPVLFIAIFKATNELDLGLKKYARYVFKMPGL